MKTYRRVVKTCIDEMADLREQILCQAIFRTKAFFRIDCGPMIESRSNLPSGYYQKIDEWAFKCARQAPNNG